MDRGGGKAQTVLLVPQELIDRIDALRIIDTKKGEPMNRSRVLENLITKVLPDVEGAKVERRLRLEALAHRAGMTYAGYIRAYVAGNIRKSHAPTLEELEEGSK